MKVWCSVMLCLLLIGCMTPMGKLNKEDLTIRQVQINVSQKEALSNLQEGIRYCGDDSDIPDSKCLNRKDETIVCDIVCPGMLGNSYALGSIEIKGTTAIMMIRNHIPGKERKFKKWELYLNGRYKESCPE